MTGVLARAAIACGLLLATGATAAAGVCPAVGEAAAGPLPGGAGKADFGAIPESCPTSDAAVRLRGIAVLASGAPDYYRSFEGGLMLRARRALGDRSWLSFAFDAVDYRYVENGGLGVGQFSLGPPTIGLYRTVFAGDATAVAVYGRALLPLETSRRVGFQTGLEIGGTFRAVPGRAWALDGGGALTLPTDVVAGQVHGHLIPVGLLEVWRSFGSALAVGLGATIKAELAPNPGLLSVAPRASARLVLRERFWLAALVEAPILGQFPGQSPSSDRTDLVASLFGGYSP